MCFIFYTPRDSMVSFVLSMPSDGNQIFHFRWNCRFCTPAVNSYCKKKPTWHALTRFARWKTSPKSGWRGNCRTKPNQQLLNLPFLLPWTLLKTKIYTRDNKVMHDELLFFKILQNSLLERSFQVTIERPALPDMSAAEAQNFKYLGLRSYPQVMLAFRDVIAPKHPLKWQKPKQKQWLWLQIPCFLNLEN